ncbi:Recombination_factor protein RarA [Hexamita inflata]|uniref:Recombination factor protein RarA n=1 Tax=Hexamita inflata TaxID=28002 RepID=A0AA86PS88_9EUKA|nr:Recombination factor protein RarA [Hexamita inflata]
MHSFHQQLRPACLQDFIGNTSVFGPTGQLVHLFKNTAQKNQILKSIIISGPSGSGKSSLAQIYVQLFESYLEQNNLQRSHSYILKQFDASNFSKQDLLAFIENNTKQNALTTPRIPVVFIDDIQSLNKTQQAPLLSLIENEKCVLIGTLNESVFREITEGIRSRTLNIVLKPLNPRETLKLLISALNKLTPLNRDLKSEEQIEPMALALIAVNAQGDARKALQLLEMSIIDGRITEQSVHTAEKMIFKAYNQTNVFYECLSALQKSIRASDPQGAIFYLAALIEAECDPLDICRRLIVIAAEDIGLGNIQALPIATACYDGVKQIGMPEGRILMAETAVFLAQQPKNNSTYAALDKALEFVRDKKNQWEQMRPREDYRNASAGNTYIYPHEFGGYVLDSALQKELQKEVFWVDQSARRPE